MNSLKQHLSNFSVLRSPFSVLRSPFSVLRSPFSVLRSIIVSITLLLFTFSIGGCGGLDGLDTSKIPILKELPGLPPRGPTVLTSCLALGAAAGYFGDKELAKLVGKGELTEKEKEDFTLGLALAGCAIGAEISTAVLDHMSEKAKEAQLAAWNEAQQSIGTPVRWSTPDGQEGIEKLEGVETSASSGERCGFRRSVIKNSQGEVTPEQRVCSQPPNGPWEPRLS